MTTNEDLTTLTDAELDAEADRARAALDAFLAERAHRTERVAAIRAERRRRDAAAAAALPPTLDVGTRLDAQADPGHWPRVHRDMVERFPLGARVRYGNGRVEWVIDWHTDDEQRPALTMRNPATTARNSSRYVYLFELGNLTRIDAEGGAR